MIDDKLKPQYKADLREYIKRAKAAKAELEQLPRTIAVEQRISECEGKIKFGMLLAKRSGFIADKEEENE